MKEVPRDHAQLMPHPYSNYCDIYNCTAPTKYEVCRPDGPGGLGLKLCETHARQLAASIPDEYLPQLLDFKADLVNQIKAQIEDDSITLRSALEIIGVPVEDGFWDETEEITAEDVFAMIRNCIDAGLLNLNDVIKAFGGTVPKEAPQIQKQVGVIAFTPEIAERMIAALKGIDDELCELLQTELDAVKTELEAAGIGDDGAPLTDKDTPPTKVYTCECGQTFTSPGAKGAHVQKCAVVQAAKAAKEGR